MHPPVRLAVPLAQPFIFLEAVSTLSHLWDKILWGYFTFMWCCQCVLNCIYYLSMKSAFSDFKASLSEGTIKVFFYLWNNFLIRKVMRFFYSFYVSIILPPISSFSVQTWRNFLPRSFTLPNINRLTVLEYLTCPGFEEIFSYNNTCGRRCKFLLANLKWRDPFQWSLFSFFIFRIW